MNLKGYVPSNKSVLVSKWRQFERSGDYEIAAKLEEKYFDLLHPEPSPPTEDAIFKAEELFLNSFPNNAALKKRIDADRTRRKRKAEEQN